MPFNVFGEKVSYARYREMVRAQKNRRELIAARLLDRRELMKMGLLTSAGFLVRKSGLSARASSPIPQDQPASPGVRRFIEPMPRIPIRQPVATLDPAPTVEPNRAAGEGRTRPHQALRIFPPKKFYVTRQQPAPISVSPDLPPSIWWTFDGHFPGPTYVARYGEPILVRNFNNLPDDNGGFGLNSVTTHLHNGHTPAESDGNPCDFFERGQFYDQHYPNVLAGVLSTHKDQGGDIREAMSTLFYHDHRIDHTAENVYKGLVGFYLLFNEFDTGDENTGFRLPSFPEFDIPMVLADKVFDDDGQLFFDLFNLDGILGDRFTVNGKIQPYFQVHPRRYRFRLLNVGPSRFYDLFLTDVDNPTARIPFWQISSDGNLLPAPVLVESVRIGVAERVDIIVDFTNEAGKSFYLENRLIQLTGKGPVAPPNDLKPAGQGDFLMRIDVTLPRVEDHSRHPEDIKKFYDLPEIVEPRITRTFKFDRLNGQWSVNGQFMECGVSRVRIKQNTPEVWVLMNLSGDWQHPVHIHFEEFQMMSRDRRKVSAVEAGRKDVVRLQQNERVELFFRFRDFLGRYPMHCHNVIHEDHAMMLLWEITEDGDSILVP
jgi:FtsP/CotA-like multicopper oxidase with cupredoxin domain